MGFPKKRSAKPEEPTDEGTSDEPTQTSAMWSPYDEGRTSRGPLWFVVGGVAVLGLLGGGLAVMWNAESPGPAQSAARRSSDPLPSAPPGEYGFAAARTTDPEPLTIKEIFGHKKVSRNGRTYTMTVTSKVKKCGDAVIGDKLAKALKAAKCTQLLRASFRDKSGNIVGTVGVANLKTTKDAKKIAAIGGKGKREVYVKPLPGKDSVTKFVGSGEGAADVWTHGHYAIMIWFQTKNGQKPDKKGTQQLAVAADDVAKSTVFEALISRSVSGSPAT
ncbi:hypothetical protein OIE66_35950 [Nonomuraea sp. NBC_01738]|uniref:hypothetical protein n=1 Tax=Nonomuraea sp. NBC_01738 TaxID=2976003 RepID=UPI002E160551|nr:hypothetical protein OIE66_35950 [Nonomuraea sp. NBC_01738]